MPRLTVRVPKYRLHKASGQAVVSLDGQTLYLGRFGTPESKANYDRLVGEWQLNGRQSLTASKLTVDEVILAYLEHAKTYYVKNGQPTTTQRHIRDALRPLHEMHGTTPAAAFGPLALQSLRQQLIERGSWCRMMINKEVGIIKRMFKWAAGNELVPPTVYQGLQTVSGLRRGRCAARETEPIKPVDESHVKAILPHVSPQIAAMVQLQMLTGMRPGEVVIMRGCDLDTSGKVWTYTPESHKTEHHGKKRVICLGPQAQAVVTPFLQRELAAYLFSPAEAEAVRGRKRREARKTPMTPSQRRRRPKKKPLRAPRHRYTRDSYRRAIERACDKAFPTSQDLAEEQAKAWRKQHRWHPNQLRHTAATKLRKEFGIEAARVVLGHSSPAMTEVYAELDHRKAADVMGKIG